MGYSRKITQCAIDELSARKRRAEGLARRNREDFYRLEPEAVKIKNSMAQNASLAAKAVLSGGDTGKELEKLKSKAKRLDAKYEALLAKHNLKKSDLQPKYTCQRCGDTGFVDGKICECLKNLERDIAYKRLSMDAPLEKCTFESFSLDYYKGDAEAYKRMSEILRYTKDYSKNFPKDSPSLLFKGGTGLGKTHLSLAIAGEAVKKGYGVIYGSVQSLSAELERERFAPREDEEEDTVFQLSNCDLLILDDLGSEFQSSYVNAVLVGIVDTRLLAKRPCIISTNLSMEQLEKRYGERLVSRIAGNFGMLTFLGSDIRVYKRRNG